MFQSANLAGKKYHGPGMPLRAGAKIAPVSLSFFTGIFQSVARQDDLGNL